MHRDNYDAGAFDDALFYAEKSLIYAQRYPSQCDKDKVIALSNIGSCLDKLNRYEESTLVY